MIYPPDGSVAVAAVVGDWVLFLLFSPGGCESTRSPRLLASKTRVTYPEPTTHGFAIRCGGDVNLATSTTCGTKGGEWTPQLTPERHKHSQGGPTALSPDLVRIATLWPKLPEYVKACTRGGTGWDNSSVGSQITSTEISLPPNDIWRPAMPSGIDSRQHPRHWAGNA